MAAAPMLLGAALVLAGFVGAPSPAPQSFVGKVVVQGPVAAYKVSLEIEGKTTVLKGDLSQEIARLTQAVVEVLGARGADGQIEVAEYRILDVGGGARPTVGVVERVGADVALRDGPGSSIPLSLPPRNKQRLLEKVGAKVWVHGPRLVTGEIKVLRYGVLREARPESVAGGGEGKTEEGPGAGAGVGETETNPQTSAD